MSKICPGKNIKAHTEPEEAFSKDKARSDGLAVYCKICAATIQREWKKNNPLKVRAQKRNARIEANK